MGIRVLKMSSSPITYNKVFAHFKDPGHGAIASFFGVVRDLNDGKKVLAVTYDTHWELAEKVFLKIIEDLTANEPDTIDVLLIHRVGKLSVGEISIAIAVSSPHRELAFSICRNLIEEVKHRAPIWKQEHYVNGDSGWVRGHSLCEKRDVKSSR